MAWLADMMASVLPLVLIVSALALLWEALQP